MQSPEYVQTSLAAAMSLGFRPARFRRDSFLTGLNLLTTYPDGCVARCGFCGLSGNRPGSSPGYGGPSPWRSGGHRPMMNAPVWSPM